MSRSAFPSRSAPAPATRWIAVCSALAVWMLGLLAASPQLHAALHSEASHLDHSCAVTLFSHGVETTTVDPSPASPPALFPTGESLCAPALPVTLPHDRLPPVCGPPRR